jgi:HK97 family phage major capsid protein
LLGHPVLIDEEMPNVAAGAFPIAFGDFSQAYLIVERPGMRLLRDPYSSKPHVLLYSYSRVGGSVSNFEAVKLLRIAASG